MSMMEENMALSVLLPVDWLNEWQCQELLEKNPLHLYRWLQLVAQAKRVGKTGDGAILNSDGTPMTAGHMRRTFGYGDEAAWNGFLLDCAELQLLALDQASGAWVVLKWRGVWYVAASDTREAMATRKATSRARAAERDKCDVTDVTDVTLEQNRTEHNRTEQRGTVLEGELEFKNLLKPLALSWNSETTKRLRKFLSLPNSLEHKRSALNLSVAKLRDGKIQNNNYAVWNVLDDAYRNVNLVQLRVATPVDRLEVANEQRRKAMGVAR